MGTCGWERVRKRRGGGSPAMSTMTPPPEATTKPEPLALLPPRIPPNPNPQPPPPKKSKNKFYFESSEDCSDGAIPRGGTKE